MCIYIYIFIVYIYTVYVYIYILYIYIYLYCIYIYMYTYCICTYIYIWHTLIYVFPLPSIFVLDKTQTVSQVALYVWTHRAGWTDQSRGSPRVCCFKNTPTIFYDRSSTNHELMQFKTTSLLCSHIGSCNFIRTSWLNRPQVVQRSKPWFCYLDFRLFLCLKSGQLRETIVFV